jgi:hypothetical protein
MTSNSCLSSALLLKQILYIEVTDGQVMINLSLFSAV